VLKDSHFSHLPQMVHFSVIIYSSMLFPKGKATFLGYTCSVSVSLLTLQPNGRKVNSTQYLTNTFI